MALLAAKRRPPLIGQVSEVDGHTVAVIWEDGRLGIFARPGIKGVIKWTSTEVLVLEP